MGFLHSREWGISHFPGDFPCVQPWLREMLNYKLRDSRLGLGKLLVSFSNKMKALKCKTLGASVMYIHCTLANIHVYTCIIFIIHSIIMHTRTNA